MTGHLLGAAGAVEAAISVKVLEGGEVPPTINYNTPDPELDLDYTPNEKVVLDEPLKAVITDNLGFGGEPRDVGRLSLRARRNAPPLHRRAQRGAPLQAQRLTTWAGAERIPRSGASHEWPKEARAGSGDWPALLSLPRRPRATTRWSWLPNPTAEGHGLRGPVVRRSPTLRGAASALVFHLGSLLLEF